MKFNYLTIGKPGNKENVLLEKLRAENIAYHAFHGEDRINDKRYQMILAEKSYENRIKNNFNQSITYVDNDAFEEQLSKAIDAYKASKGKQFIALRDIGNNLIFVQESSIEKITKEKEGSLLVCRGNSIQVREGLFYIYRHLFDKNEFRYYPFSSIRRI